MNLPTKEQPHEWMYKEILPSDSTNTQPKHAFVFMHGLGSDYTDLEGLAAIFSQEFPNSVCILVNAPHDFGDPSCGRQWFNFGDKNEAFVKKEVQLASKTFSSFLKLIRDKFNLTNNQIALVGFSQGGMMASYVGIENDIGCVIGLASCVVSPAVVERQSNTPMCFIHGLDDEIIPEKTLFRYSIAQSAPYLSRAIKVHVLPDIRHAMDMQSLKLAIDFAHNIFSSESNHAQ